MEVGKEGELDINFSSDMVFPDEWTAKLQSDTDTLAKEEAGAVRRRRRRLQEIDEIKFYIKRPN